MDIKEVGQTKSKQDILKEKIEAFKTLKSDSSVLIKALSSSTKTPYKVENSQFL